MKGGGENNENGGNGVMKISGNGLAA